MNGPILIRRARYRCSKTGRMVFPLDAILDLPACEVSVSLARRALRLGTFTSFAASQAERHRKLQQAKALRKQANLKLRQPLLPWQEPRTVA